MNVNIQKTGNIISVSAPYNEHFVAESKLIGGKWQSQKWVFDARDENRVRELCIKYYGTDGITNDLVTLRIDWIKEEEEYCDPLSVNGRPIARAYGRDTGAKLCDGVVLLAGGFTSSGSTKWWTTKAYEGTAVLVRDFPKKIAEKLIEAASDKYRSYSIEDEAAPIDRDALIAERERLMARIEEINSLLSE